MTHQEVIDEIKSVELSPLSIHYTLTFYHDDSGIICRLPGGTLLNISEFAKLFSVLLNNYSHNHLPQPAQKQITVEIPHQTTATKSKECGVYIIQSGTFFKIGCSSHIPDRTKTIIDGLKPYKAKVIKIIKTQQYYELEQKLHQEFNSKRIRGEWFELDQNDIDYIKSLGE